MKSLTGCILLVLFVTTVSYSNDLVGSCSPKKLFCVEKQGKGSKAGEVYMGQCMKYLPPGCDDCPHTNYGKYAKECNSSYGSACVDGCYACYPADGSSFSGMLTCYDTNGKAHTIP
ncbi:MAG: hypothetical protein LWW87_02650 [Geobacteraceae bacterium]|nr:hypothetical protein [Geobacteraceae bacterium]